MSSKISKESVEYLIDVLVQARVSLADPMDYLIRAKTALLELQAELAERGKDGETRLVEDIRYDG